jgi:hypothetical protein
MRTIDDLDSRFGAAETGSGTELTDKDSRVEEEKIVERSIQVSLTLRDDFDER